MRWADRCGARRHASAVADVTMPPFSPASRTSPPPPRATAARRLTRTASGKQSPPLRPPQRLRRCAADSRHGPGGHHPPWLHAPPAASLTHQNTSTIPMVGESPVHDAVSIPLPPPPHSNHPHLPATPPLGPRPPPQRHHLGRTAPPYQGWGAAAPHSPTPAKACGRSRRRVFPTDRRRKRLVVQGAAGRGARTQGERYCKTGRRAPRATSRVRLCVAARDSVAARRRRQGLGVEDGVEGGGLHLHQRLPRLCERRDMHGADGEKQEKETMIGRGRQHNQQRAADASATRPTRRRYASQIHPPVTSPPLSSDSSVCRLPGRRNRYRSGTVTIAQHWRGRLV